MALPEKVLEQLAREPPKTPGWAGQFLTFSATIFFLALFIYAGTVYGYRPYLGSKVDELKGQLQLAGQQIPVEEQAKIANFYSQVVNLGTLLRGRTFVSGIFAWFEKNTQVNIYYNRFNLNVPNNQLSLGGIAKTVEDANQQFAIFQSRPEVGRINVDTIVSAAGVWQFDITIFFAPDYFSGSTANL